MYKFLIAVGLGIFLTGCASNSINLDTDPDCKPKWWKNERKFFWEKSYVSKPGKATIYGRGTERAFDRNTARRAAEALARADVLNQIQSQFENDFDRKYEETQTREGTAQNANAKKEFIDNITSKVYGSCKMCFIVKFEDCFQKGMWSAYALAEMDHDSHKSAELQALLKSSFDGEKKEGGIEF